MISLSHVRAFALLARDHTAAVVDRDGVLFSNRPTARLNAFCSGRSTLGLTEERADERAAAIGAAITPPS
jgi:hypothetical protein